MVGRQEVTAQVHLDDRVPLLHRHLRDGAVAQDPGVVDQRVQPAPGVDGPRHQGPRRVVLGAVAGVQHGLAAGRRDLVDDGLPGLGVQLVDHHPGTLAGQLERLAAADAAACAGDDRDPAVQKTHAGDPMRRPGDAPTRPGARTAGSPGPC